MGHKTGMAHIAGAQACYGNTSNVDASAYCQGPGLSGSGSRYVLPGTAELLYGHGGYDGETGTWRLLTRMATPVPVPRGVIGFATQQ